jgi:hypothetical protein
MEPQTPVLPGTQEMESVYRSQDGTEKYTPLPSFHTENAIITRWKLTEAERQHIADGGDLFVAILNYGKPIWPIMPMALTPDEALTVVLEVEQNLNRSV